MTHALLAGSYASVKMPKHMRFGDIVLPTTLVAPGAVTTALDDVQAHQVHLHADITAAAADIESTPEGQRFFDDWVAFQIEWSRFYAQHSRGLWAALTYGVGETVSGLRSYASQYNALEARFRQLTGRAPTYNPEPPSSQFLPTEAWIGIGLGAFVLTLGFAAWGLSSYARVAAPVARARASAM